MRWGRSAFDVAEDDWLDEHQQTVTLVPGALGETGLKCHLMLHYLNSYRMTRDASVSGSHATEVDLGKVDTRWVFDIINSTDANGAALIDTTIIGINRLIAAHSFDYLNSVLDAVPTQTAGRHVLLALARATYPVSAYLARWRPFTFSVRDAFVHRGLDAGKLLRGLID